MSCLVASQPLSYRVNIDLVLVLAPAKAPRRDFVGLDGDVLGVCGDLLSAREIGREDNDLVIGEFLLRFFFAGAFLVARAVLTSVPLTRLD